MSAANGAAHPSPSGDPELDDALAELARRRRRRVAGVVGVLVLVAGLLWWFNRGTDRGGVVECGDLDGGAVVAAGLPHDRYCRLAGTVVSTVLLNMGKVEAGAATEAGTRARLRYFALLPGGVVAALSGGDPAVEAWRAPRDHLQGFRVAGVGRVFDPAREKGYGGMAAALRAQFGVAEGVEMRVFDTADRPAP
ncbi:MAG: hypothetical protein H6703_05080 [Myxococcales bacterium]|nr:hypothetical protein [Myxococcales bacterium]